jgi:uncharacterized protein YcbK (DUF882 family)
MRLAGLLVLGAAVVAAAAEPRFFVVGDGTLDIASKPLGEHVTVRYRRDDGTYDYEAMERIRHILRCRGDGYEAEITPRFVELLGYMNVRSGRPLALLSGSRSPVYNDGIRQRGLPAARDSLHTEGIAADLAFPREQLEPLWFGIRDLDCCGAGYYPKEGFLHVDVGKPRFWEPSTSGVDENLSAGNARVFARTDYDRYVRGEMMLVRLYAVTLPPIGLERTARLVAEGDGRGSTVKVEQVGAPGGSGCIQADRTTRLLVKDAPAVARGRIVFTTCAPRAERTPATVETNPVSLR